ncbi:MAG: tRNA-intron lyase [Nitrososphaerales archaeon]
MEELLKIKLERGNFVVKEPKEELEQKGYGEKREGKLILAPYEALYLVHIEKAQVFKKRELMSFEKLLNYIKRKDKKIMTKFLIYKDLRNRGYVVKEGFGFGSDFRVYDRGDYGSKSAKYVVFALSEGTEISLKELPKIVNEIYNMGKEAILGVVERRGEVIYYKLSKAKFIF